MNTKALFCCLALALCVQYSQARELLSATPATGNCSSTGLATFTCDAPLVATMEASFSVVNVSSAVDAKASCCVYPTAKTCFDYGSCGAGYMAIVNNNASSISNKTAAQAKTQCCKALLTAATVCSNLTATSTPAKPVCPEKKTIDEAANLDGVDADDAAAVKEQCCTDLPVCAAANCPAGMELKNASVPGTPDTEELRLEQCCVFKANTTCANPDANATTPGAANCSEWKAGYEAKASAVDASIAGLAPSVALTTCCSASKYPANTTCESIATTWNCSAVAGKVTDPAKVNTTLEDVDRTDAATAAICCKAAPDTPGTDDTTGGKNTTKNSATSATATAASFLLSTVALLAMLVL